MPVQEQTQQSKLNKESNGNQGLYPDIERIYNEWDAALSKNDVAALLNLYAEDAELESPLVPHLMGGKRGVLRGRAELKKLFDILAGRKPRIRQFYRTGYFTDGRKVIWEYPHTTPEGEEMDFVEVMEIENGLITRIYITRNPDKLERIRTLLDAAPSTPH